MQQAVISPSETFTLDTIYGKTLGESYSTLEVYDNWGTKIRDYLSYEPQGSEIVELGQFEYIYAYNEETETDNTGAAYKLRGAYGSDINISSASFFGGQTGEKTEGALGNNAISNYNLFDTVEGIKTIRVGYWKQAEAEEWTLAGQIDDTNVYETTIGTVHVYKIAREIETTVGMLYDEPATSVLNVYVASALSTVTLTRLEELFGTLTYIDPQKISIGHHKHKFSSGQLDTQWFIDTRAGVQVTEEAEADLAYYYAEDHDSLVYYDRLANLTFTPYSELYFIIDEEIAVVYENTGTATPFYIMISEFDYPGATEKLASEEVSPGQIRYVPIPQDPATPSVRYVYMQCYSEPDTDTYYFPDSEPDQTIAYSADCIVTINPEEAFDIDFDKYTMSFNAESLTDTQTVYLDPDFAVYTLTDDTNGKLSYELVSSVTEDNSLTEVYNVTVVDTSANFTGTITATSGAASITCDVTFTA